MAAVVVYRLYDRHGFLLYVGCTTDLERRLAAHKRIQAWWSDVAHVTALPFDDVEAAYRAEAHAIYTEHPQHNVAGNTGGPQDRLDGLLTYFEAAKALSVSESVVQRLTKAGDLRYVEVGPNLDRPKRRIRESALEDYINRLDTAAPRAAS